MAKLMDLPCEIHIKIMSCLIPTPEVLDTLNLLLAMRGIRTIAATSNYWKDIILTAIRPKRMDAAAAYRKANDIYLEEFMKWEEGGESDFFSALVKKDSCEQYVDYLDELRYTVVETETVPEDTTRR